MAAIRTALQRLGFTQEAAVHITNVQNLTDLDEFKILTDSEVESLCRVVRKPGGTIPNPNPAGGPPIPDPGTPVSLQACNNLKLMCFLLRFKERTSRPIVPADITVDSVRALIGYRQWEEKHEDPDTPELTFKDWPRTIEVIEEYLRACLGTTKIPLAYIIREDPTVVPPAQDPSADYLTLQDEMIARAPHTEGNPPVHTQAYKDDNVAVFQKIAELTREKDCWTYVQKSARTRDGRKAFYGLKDHYLGHNNVDNMASSAETKLKTTTYTGEQRRWNFEKYVRTHVDQHAILEGLTRHGYAGIDPRSKVRFLLEGIKTHEFDHVKSTIMASATLRQDFDLCVNLFQDFIKQSAPNRTANISAIQVRPNNGQANNNTSTADWDNVAPDMTIEDRYYNKQEYSKLTQAQRKGLDIKRKKRGHVKGGKDSKMPNRTGKGNFSRREVKALKRMLGSGTDHDATNIKQESDDESDTPPPTDNRRNRALKRKKT